MHVLWWGAPIGGCEPSPINAWLPPNIIKISALLTESPIKKSHPPKSSISIVFIINLSTLFFVLSGRMSMIRSDVLKKNFFFRDHPQRIFCSPLSAFPTGYWIVIISKMFFSGKTDEMFFWDKRIKKKKKKRGCQPFFFSVVHMPWGWDHTIIEHIVFQYM